MYILQGLYCILCVLFSSFLFYRFKRQFISVTYWLNQIHQKQGEQILNYTNIVVQKSYNHPWWKKNVQTFITLVQISVLAAKYIFILYAFSSPLLIFWCKTFSNLLLPHKNKWTKNLHLLAPSVWSSLPSTVQHSPYLCLSNLPWNRPSSFRL